MSDIISSKTPYSWAEYTLFPADEPLLADAAKKAAAFILADMEAQNEKSD